MKLHKKIILKQLIMIQHKFVIMKIYMKAINIKEIYLIKKLKTFFQKVKNIIENINSCLVYKH